MRTYYWFYGTICHETLVTHEVLKIDISRNVQTRHHIQIMESKIWRYTGTLHTWRFAPITWHDGGGVFRETWNKIIWFICFLQIRLQIWILLQKTWWFGGAFHKLECGGAIYLERRTGYFMRAKYKTRWNPYLYVFSKCACKWTFSKKLTIWRHKPWKDLLGQFKCHETSHPY